MRVLYDFAYVITGELHIILLFFVHASDVNKIMYIIYHIIEFSHL